MDWAAVGPVLEAPWAGLQSCSRWSAYAKGSLGQVELLHPRTRLPLAAALPSDSAKVGMLIIQFIMNVCATSLRRI